jgi:hypothetical protein
MRTYGVVGGTVHREPGRDMRALCINRADRFEAMNEKEEDRL